MTRSNRVSKQIHRLWKTKARTAPLQANYHLYCNLLCAFPSRSVPILFTVTACGEQSRPLPLDAANAVAAVIPSRPPAVSPRSRALPSRGGRRRQFGSLERVAKKHSESALLILAVKTDTGGALLDCTHFFFSSSKSQALPVIGDGSGDAFETTYNTWWLEGHGSRDPVVCCRASLAFLMV